MKRAFQIFLLLLITLSCFSQETDKEKKSFWDRKFGKFLVKMDNMVKDWQEAGVDTNYIKAHDKDRFVYLGGYGYYQQHDMNFPVAISSEDYPQLLRPYLPSNLPDKQYVGLDVHTIQGELELGIDWRGIAIEIPIPIRNKYSQSFGLAKNGSVWGFRIRYKNLNNMEGTLDDSYGQMGKQISSRMSSDYQKYVDAGKTAQDYVNDLYAGTISNHDPVETTAEKVSPGKLNLRIFYAEGYYVFNHKHFSLAAGVYGDMIQRKSAGSLFTWLNYYQSRLACDNVFNNDRDTFRNNKVSLGIGYGYNFSLMRSKLCLHLSFIPMFSLYNHLTHKTYAHEYENQNEKKFWETYDRHYYDAVDYGSDSGFTANGMFKFAASYSHKRMVYNLLLNYRQYLYTTSSRLSIANREADMQLNVGYRF